MSWRAVASLFLLAACGPAKPLGPEGPHLLWEADVASLDNPFPDARFLGGTGATYRANWYRPFIMATAATPGVAHLLDGYTEAAKTQVHSVGAFGPTLIRPSVRVDPATLTGAVARLVNRGGTWSVLEASVAVEHSRSVLEGSDRMAGDDFPEFFLARPGVPLPSGTTGMLVVKKGPKTLDGVALERGRSFDAAKPDLAPLAQALGIDAGDILLALLQVPAPALAPWPGLVAWAGTAAGVPAISIPAKGQGQARQTGSRPVGVWTAADADWSIIRRWLELRTYGRPSTAVGRVVLGTFGLRDLRENGVWRDDWVADPSKAPVVQVPFVLSVPAGPKPAGGWRTIIGGHGIGGRNVPVSSSDTSFCLEEAVGLAQRGLACLGIDAPVHGERGNYADFFAVDAVPKIRENFREMPFDLLQVARAIPVLDVDGDGQPDLSTEYGYFGNSLGAIMGTPFTAVSTDLSYSVLNVPGGGLSNILVGPDIRELIGLLLCAKTDLVAFSTEYYSSFFAFRAAAQPFIEEADPINFAGSLRPELALLQQEGLRDQLIPNFASDNLAAAFGMTPATASKSGTAPLKVFTVHDPAKYFSAQKAATYNGHNVYNDIAPVREEVLKFLETRGRELVLAQ